MKRNQSSITAEGIALTRAIESSKPEGERVCYDPYAHYFVNPVLAFLGRALAGYGSMRSPGVMEFLATRTRYFDDYLQSRIADGIEQLVILGAGFDSRAYRFEELKGHVKVFEMDHPATQQVKKDRLGKIFGKLPEHVVFVPIDFATETLDKLFACRYDKRLKTLFTWEGVVYYLAAEAVDSTLAFVAKNSGEGSAIIFDYVYTAALEGTMKRNEVKSMQRYRRFTGEGLVFGIERGQIEEFLNRRGFGHVVNVDSDALKNLYLSGKNGHRVIAPAYAIVHATVKTRAE